MVAGGAATVRGLRIQQRADLSQRLLEAGERPAVDCCGAGRRPIEAEDEPHGGGFAGAVRAEEPGDPTGRTWNESRSTARVLPYSLVSSRTSMVGMAPLSSADRCLVVPLRAGHGLPRAGEPLAGRSRWHDEVVPRLLRPLTRAVTYTRWLHLCIPMTIIAVWLFIDREEPVSRRAVDLSRRVHPGDADCRGTAGTVPADPGRARQTRCLDRHRAVCRPGRTVGAPFSGSNCGWCSPA